MFGPQITNSTEAGMDGAEASFGEQMVSDG